ncbi:hypothetical protein GTA08_BOTSDO06160 [Botryosphaeria dothidea]|uniref:Uncharacterized protein n=1 Tax=Botryosphaeria dothidea TaxID=55169 RepID=A0A8H4IJS6_9PEZI|nr:hypothetical protein GTA08_BOTSDO10339 [Botryosphaeria dothidea]KAF4305003.1 hypothetical protein GTA08_BOTSDO06160 [Botryosphaeria dothidea]
MANRSTNGLMVPLPGGYQTKGTPISLAPVMVKGQQRINLYSYAGEILEVLFDSPSNSTEDLLKNSPSTLYARISITRPDSGGVWTTRKKEIWETGHELDSMSTVVKGSAIAANQERRVYAMAKRNDTLALVEWAIDDGGNATEIGPVNTTVPVDGD